MPQFDKHDSFNTAVGVILLLAMVSLDIECQLIAIGFASFIFATYFMSPDLDVECKSYYRWWILRFYWLPYRWIMKHRGSSHHVVWGPLSLLGYVGLPFVVLYIFEYIHFNIYIVLPVVVGIVLATESHILLDWFK